MCCRNLFVRKDWTRRWRKALLYISHNKLKKDFELFNIAESNGKLKVKMTDIIYM